MRLAAPAPDDPLTHLPGKLSSDRCPGVDIIGERAATEPPHWLLICFGEGHLAGMVKVIDVVNGSMLVGHISDRSFARPTMKEED